MSDEAPNEMTAFLGAIHANKVSEALIRADAVGRWSRNPGLADFHLREAAEAYSELGLQLALLREGWPRLGRASETPVEQAAEELVF